MKTIHLTLKRLFSYSMQCFGVRTQQYLFLKYFVLTLKVLKCLLLHVLKEPMHAAHSACLLTRLSLKHCLLEHRACYTASHCIFLFELNLLLFSLNFGRQSCIVFWGRYWNHQIDHPCNSHTSSTYVVLQSAFFSAYSVLAKSFIFSTFFIE